MTPPSSDFGPIGLDRQCFGYTLDLRAQFSLVGPDPEDLDELYPRSRPVLRSYTPQLQLGRRNSPAEGLLGELNGIFEGIAHFSHTNALITRKEKSLTKLKALRA